MIHRATISRALTDKFTSSDEKRPVRILMILLDGVGLPPDAPEHPGIYRHAPNLLGLIRDHGAALDACLGLPGPPQSATGQTALLTGVNAADLLGQHLQAFPNARLRRLIGTHNVFTRIQARGCSCTFANAYVRGSGRTLPLMLRSVTTVAALAAFGETRSRADLLAGNAVYHDITRRTLPEHGIAGVPEISEEVAAGHLLSIARTVDFCLFEFFLTDRTGHRGSREDKAAVLASLDRFLGELTGKLDSKAELLLITSDHGNIEDPSRRGHTRNPVPLIVRGPAAEEVLVSCRDLTDVTPAVLALLAPKLRYR
ncbi:MAG: peptidase [Kiritimatiellaeota bacterium]|nr:peptidase [Kiritimatiellota bacterium]